MLHSECSSEARLNAPEGHRLAPYTLSLRQLFFQYAPMMCKPATPWRVEQGRSLINQSTTLALVKRVVPTDIVGAATRFTPL